MKAKVEAETPVKTADSRLVQPCVPCKDTLAARQQDSMYGKNMRVHNPTIKSGKGANAQYRCTVCSSTK